MDRQRFVRRACAAAFLFFSTLTFSQKLVVLHTFTGPDGVFPTGGLIRGNDGNFYGTTFGGGTYGGGTVFRMTPAGELTTLYTFTGTFTGGHDGLIPAAPVIRDAAGNLYGTTNFGGTADVGTVFKITSSNKETVLYSFTGGADGSQPTANVIRDEHGNLYGTTTLGGTCTELAKGCGVVFKIDPQGNETVIHDFQGGVDGAGPSGGLVMDAAGNLYGATVASGLFNAGTVFKIDPSGNKTVIYDFDNSTGMNGNGPGDLAFGPGQILYGITAYGGDVNFCAPFGCGTVFNLDTHDNETVLHGFDGADGDSPDGPVSRDSAGNLYGTAATGCANNWGCIYKIDTSNHETVLYSFTNGNDGGSPDGRLYVSPNGTIYGMTGSGGTSDLGVIFKLTP
jgi:uncharacterized repeat protein (TIGR03803 family)